MKKAFVFVGTCLVILLGLLTACTQSAGTSQEGGYKTMTVKKRIVFSPTAIRRW